MDLRHAIEARDREDRRGLVLQLALAIPFTLFGVFFANVLFVPIHFLLHSFNFHPGFWMLTAGFNLALIAAILMDLKRHPEGSWYVPRYVKSDGRVSSHEFATHPLAFHHLESAKGVLSGMPLTARMTPGNLGERGRSMANGFAHLIMGGPRSIAEVLAVRRRISGRSSSRAVSSAERFLAWLGTRVVHESDVKARLETHPDLAEGLALALEVEVVTRRRLPAEFHYHLRTLAGTGPDARMGRP